MVVARSLTLVAVSVLAIACAVPGPATGPAESPTGIARSSAPPDFAFGAWTMTLTDDDWMAAGITGREDIEQNTGEFVLDFDPDGTWRSVQTSLTGIALREPIFRGTYTVDGDELRLETDFPEHYKAEGVYIDLIRWRLEGDELHLDLIDFGDQYTAVVYGTEVWVRP